MSIPLSSLFLENVDMAQSPLCSAAAGVLVRLASQQSTDWSDFGLIPLIPSYLGKMDRHSCMRSPTLAGGVRQRKRDIKGMVMYIQNR